MTQPARVVFLFDAAGEMLPRARTRLGREAVLDRWRKDQVRFTAEGEPLPQSS